MNAITIKQTKPGYKKTPVGVIPEDWEVKRIKSVADVIGGGTPSTTEVKYWNGNINWFTPSEIKGKFVSKSERKITKAGLKNSSAKELPIGTILLTTRATIGEASLSTEISTTNQGFQSLVCKKGANNIFLYELIKFNKNELYRRANGSTFLEISGKEIKQIPLAIPPLPEQNAIADCLSTWDKGIEKLSALIASKKEQKKGLMQQLLTGKKRLAGFTEEWRKVKLGDVTNVKSSKRVLKKDWLDYGVPFYRTREVIRLANKQEFRAPIFISEKLYLKLSEKYGVPNDGDLLVTGVGTIGETYVVEEGDRFYFKDGNVLWIQITDEINSYFLHYSFKARYIRKQLIDNASITTVATFTIEGAKGTNILLPSIEEQVAIAGVLTTIDKEINLLDSKLEALQTQKKGLMQVLLTGERRLV